MYKIVQIAGAAVAIAIIGYVIVDLTLSFVMFVNFSKDKRVCLAQQSKAKHLTSRVPCE